MSELGKSSNRVPPKQAATVRIFAPELWGQVQRFEFLHSETHKLEARDRRALAGVRAHFEKAKIFEALATKFRVNLEIDEAELAERGYTAADNARELAALIEAAVNELYSSVDCTAKVLRAIYGDQSRKFRDSTRALFQRVGEIEGAFPEELKVIIGGASWYLSLLHLRDELTHSSTGSCHFDETKTKVRYMHMGLTIGDKPLIIDDIFSWLSDVAEAVNRFLGAVFAILLRGLGPTPVVAMCGLVQGRMLMRYVNPCEPLDFNSGRCGSYQWFEKPGEPLCPFVLGCGAYKRTRPTMDAEVLVKERAAS